MKSLWRKKGPENSRNRPKPRRKFAKWLAVPLLAIGLASCALPSTVNDNRNTAAHEVGASNPECTTWGSSNTLKNSTQYIERTICKGELEEEVTTFDPPIEKANERAPTSESKITVLYMGDERILSPLQGMETQLLVFLPLV